MSLNAFAKSQLFLSNRICNSATVASAFFSSFPFYSPEVDRDATTTERDRSSDAHMAPKERKNMRHATYI